MNEYSDLKNSEDSINKMRAFLVDSIFMVCGKNFQQIVGITISTDPVYIFLYSYEAEFIQSLLSMGRMQ